MEFHFRNSNDAFNTLVKFIRDNQDSPHLVRENSRNGEVISFKDPVTVAYTSPWERVLWHPARDCNPFFHLFEAVWMLAGSNRLKPLTRYVKKMKEFSDDGETLHGAYGYRWRNSICGDQLTKIVNELKDNPQSRRCVLQMWDARADDSPALSGSCADLDIACNGGKDVPCNSHAYFRIVNDRLTMTVCNRSNDMVWGMLGANYVHFSFLQEYMAARIGVPVGTYYQVTNNLHVYTWNFEPDKWLEGTNNDPYTEKDMGYSLLSNTEHWGLFDMECRGLVSTKPPYYPGEYRSDFLSRVFVPAMNCHYIHKVGDTAEAKALTAGIEEMDWQIACREWLQRRL